MSKNTQTPPHPRICHKIKFPLAKTIKRELLYRLRSAASPSLIKIDFYRSNLLKKFRTISKSYRTNLRPKKILGSPSFAQADTVREFTPYSSANCFCVKALSFRITNLPDKVAGATQAPPKRPQRLFLVSIIPTPDSHRKRQILRDAQAPGVPAPLSPKPSSQLDYNETY